MGNHHVTRNPKYGAFQKYSVLPTQLVAPIPDSMGYEAAVVLPTGTLTAAAMLFNPDLLALPLPTMSPAPISKSAVLVWGGSSSVGASAIQLARATGAEVLTTVSPRNFELVKGLGASHIFDRNNPSVVTEIVAALTGKTLLGVANAIGNDKAALDASIEVVVQTGAKVRVINTRQLEPDLDPRGVEVKPGKC